MPHPDKPSTGFSLTRWSKRKLAAARAGTAEPIPSPPALATGEPAAAAPASSPAPPELPPVETLTIESDFSAFLQPKVDEPLKRAALRKLFSDPRFNVMDGLDVYIDDYSKSEPIPPELLSQLAHARAVLDPPATRVNASGEVEEVPAGGASASPPCASEPTAIGGASAEGSREAAAAMGPSHLPGESARMLEQSPLAGIDTPAGEPRQVFTDDRGDRPDDAPDDADSMNPSTRASVKGR